MLSTIRKIALVAMAILAAFAVLFADVAAEANSPPPATPTPTPMPSAATLPPTPGVGLRVISPSSGTVLEVGQSVRLILRLKNMARVPRERGGVSLSVPPDVEIEVIESDSELGSVEIHNPGDWIWHKDGRRIRAHRRIVETDSSDWTPRQHGYLVAVLTPTVAEPFYIELRAQICSERHMGCEREPSRFSRDERGFPVERDRDRDERGFPVERLRIDVRQAPAADSPTTTENTNEEDPPCNP